MPTSFLRLYTPRMHFPPPHTQRTAELPRIPKNKRIPTYNPPTYARFPPTEVQAYNHKRYCASPVHRHTDTKAGLRRYNCAGTSLTCPRSVHCGIPAWQRSARCNEVTARKGKYARGRAAGLQGQAIQLSGAVLTAGTLTYYSSD